MTADGFTGSIQLREGTSGRTFSVERTSKSFVVDGAPAASVKLTHNDITGEIEVVR